MAQEFQGAVLMLIAMTTAGWVGPCTAQDWPTRPADLASGSGTAPSGSPSAVDFGPALSGNGAGSAISAVGLASPLAPSGAGVGTQSGAATITLGGNPNGTTAIGIQMGGNGGGLGWRESLGIGRR
jgi:hypothetical protein